MKHTLLVLAVLMSGTLSAQYSIKLTKDYKTIFKPKYQHILDKSLWMRGWENTYYFADSPLYSQIRDSFTNEVTLSTEQWVNPQFNEELYIFHSHKDKDTFRNIQQFVLDKVLDNTSYMSRKSGPGYIAYLQLVDEIEVVIVVIFYS